MLMIVDVQNDFCEGGALAVSGGSAVAAGITELIASHGKDYAAIVASRDWHRGDGLNGGHFAAPGTDPDFVQTWPVHCVANSPGAQFHPNLEPSRFDYEVKKGQGVPAYSAFEGRTDEGFSMAGLIAQLGITQLDVAGIATDYCVKATVLDALKLGLKVQVLTNVIAGVDPISSQQALTQMEAAGAILV